MFVHNDIVVQLTGAAVHSVVPLEESNEDFEHLSFCKETHLLKSMIEI